MVEKNAEAGEKPGGKPTGKKDIAGFVMLAIAAMAGSFGVSYLMPSSSEAVAIEACTADGPTHTQTATVADKNLVYVDLPDILTTIGSEPATRYIKMNVTIATNKLGADTVDASKLVLMDAFISYLRSVELTNFEDPAFYGHMRKQLAHRSEIILGASASEGILITEFLLR